MKRSITLLLLAFTAATAHAGSFGGPTSLNTSTQTGAVGVYQATVRGNSLAGIVQFAYNTDGNPTSSTVFPSTYVFFIDGMIFKGTVDASIQSSKISSILENGTVSPAGFISPLFAGYELPGGYWEANINTGSANYFFKGKGSVTINSQATPTDPWIVSNRNFKIAGQRTSTTD